MTGGRSKEKFYQHHLKKEVQLKGHSWEEVEEELKRKKQSNDEKISWESMAKSTLLMIDKEMFV